jgi:hypothetical protein
MKKKQLYQERRELAIENFRQEELTLLASPKISEKSQQLAKVMQMSANVVERLYCKELSDFNQIRAWFHLAVC